MQITSTVRNRGSGPSEITVLRYYVSTDATISPDDTEVGKVRVSPLSGSENVAKSVSARASSIPGNYYYGACVDAVDRESDTTNNCSEAATVAVIKPLPDLVVDEPTVSESSPMAGAFLKVTVSLGNRGDESSAATTLRYYRSTDPIINPADTELEMADFSELSTSESLVDSIYTYAPATSGTYYYGACLDPAKGERDTANNCSSTVPTVVSEFNIEKLPWVMDGVTDREQLAFDHIGVIAQTHPSVAQRIAGSPWVLNDLSSYASLTDISILFVGPKIIEYDLPLLVDLRNLVYLHPEAAVLAMTVPDPSGRLVNAIVGSLRILEDDRLEKLLGRTWVKDGLTRKEAAFISVLHRARAFDEVSGDSLDQHVRLATISLPMAGDVDVIVVGELESDLDATLELVKVGVKALEGTMGTSWPNPVVIVLDLSGPRISGIGSYAGTYIETSGSRFVTWHESAHYYFNLNTPSWFREGAADYLTFYVMEQMGLANIFSEYNRRLASIKGDCAPHGVVDVHSWIDATTNGPSSVPRICQYHLGFVFLAGLHLSVGDEVVLDALRELYEESPSTGRSVTEDEIYWTFWRKIPESQLGEYLDHYSRIHGGPIPSTPLQ